MPCPLLVRQAQNVFGLRSEQSLWEFSQRILTFLRDGTAASCPGSIVTHNAEGAPPSVYEGGSLR
jgi:hypothetical protein